MVLIAFETKSPASCEPAAALLRSLPSYSRVELLPLERALAKSGPVPAFAGSAPFSPASSPSDSQTAATHTSLPQSQIPMEGIGEDSYWISRATMYWPDIVPNPKIRQQTASTKAAAACRSPKPLAVGWRECGDWTPLRRRVRIAPATGGLSLVVPAFSAGVNDVAASVEFHVFVMCFASDRGGGS